METVFFFKNMLPDEEGHLREYVFGKLSKFEKIMSRFPDDGVVLQVKGEKFQKHSAYDVELVIKFGGQTLSAKEASHMITKAVDLAKDRLDLQLRKTLLHKHRDHRSIRAKTKMEVRTSTLA